MPAPSSSWPPLHHTSAGHTPCSATDVAAQVAASLLAQQGLRVEVYDEKGVVGGACRTEYPFKKLPGMPQSTGG